MRKALFALALLIMSTLPAAATEQLVPAIPPIIVTYDVYVGGIHLLTADILFHEEKGKYQSYVQGRTYGFWYKMLPWNTSLKVQGKIHGDRFVPVEFATHDKFGSKPAKITKLHFKNNGDVQPEFDPPNTDTNRDVVTLDERRHSLDPVSALLQMIASVAIEGDCNITVPVFDGKRRFDISGMDAGQEYIYGEDYGVFTGMARKCDATFKSVAGEWNDKTKDRFWKKSADGQDRDPFHIWMGDIAPELPEMPVRLESGSVWGNIVMHLTKWRPASKDDLAVTD